MIWCHLFALLHHIFTFFRHERRNSFPERKKKQLWVFHHSLKLKSCPVDSYKLKMQTLNYWALYVTHKYTHTHAHLGWLKKLGHYSMERDQKVTQVLSWTCADNESTKDHLPSCLCNCLFCHSIIISFVRDLS